MAQSINDPTLEYFKLHGMAFLAREIDIVRSIFNEFPPSPSIPQARAFNGAPVNIL